MTDNKLNDNELDVLVIRTQNMSAADLQDALKRNIFSTKEVPYIEGYLQHKLEEERNAPVTMYHRRKAPEGKVFKAYEMPVLEKKGWVDSPDKFKEGIKSKIKRIIKAIWNFLLKAMFISDNPKEVQNSISTRPKHWYEKPIGIIFIGVLIVIFSAFALWTIKYFFPNLKL